MAFPRTLAVLAAASALVAGCGHHAARPPGPSSTTVSKPVAAPAPPVCADPTPPCRAIDPRQAGPAADGGSEERRRRPGRCQRLPRRWHLHRQLDGPVDFKGPLADIAAKAGPLPLAVSVDEEGGRVSRLKSLIGPAPSARELAQTQTVAQVHDLAAERGKKMRELGITIDFAPVVDVTDAPDDSVIGDRSFGSDPETVTAVRRGVRARSARRRAATGAQAFPRSRAWLGRFAQRRAWSRRR